MWLELIGYAASLLIAVSLMMNSIIKLRIYGLIGSLLFAIYGFVIDAYPVGILNTINVAIHIYYLIKEYNEKEYFKILEVRPENKYLLYFLEFYIDKIKKFFPNFNYDYTNNEYFTFFVVRNLTVAGIFIGKRNNDNQMEIILDFVIPEYRDFKIGYFLYKHNTSFFKERNISHLICTSSSDIHLSYLSKMGFSVYDSKCYLNII